MTKAERVLRDKQLAAIEREIRRWDGLDSQADLQAAAQNMARFILRAVRTAGRPPRARDTHAS